MTGPEIENEDPGVAAEYALGVLEAGERRAAERRLAADNAFAVEVKGWEDRLHPMLDAVPAELPSAALWPRIDASVGARTAVRSPSSSPASWWSSLAFWRGATAGMGALAAAAVAAAVLQPAAEPVRLPTPSPEAQPPMLVANLAAERGQVMFLVAFDPMRGTTMVTPLTPEQDRRAYELWIIPADGRPRSLGVVGMAGTRRYALSDELKAMVATGQGTLAISLEPEGGSPTGAPTGPVVATGSMARA